MSDADPTSDTPYADEHLASEPVEAAPQSPPPAGTYVIKQQPAWTYFLTPMAILIGALIVAGAIWRFTGEEDGGTVAAFPTVTVDTDGAVSSASQTPSTQPATLLSTFTGYAKAVGVSESAFQACLSKQSNVDLITRHYSYGSQLGITGTPTFYINNKMLIGSQPLAIFEEIVAAELAGSPTSLDSYSANVKALAATNPPRFAIVEGRPDLTGAVFEGNQNAKVVIAEFSDFQCPFCKRWVSDTLPTIRAKYIPQGVAMAWMHFPITSIHPNAGNASVAAMCAGESGKFWEMHDLLFARQDEWASLQQ